MNQPDPSEHPTAALRRMHRWRMALSGLMILVAGITLGAAGTIMIVRPHQRTPAPSGEPEQQAEWTLNAMSPELHLAPDQFREIRTILREGFQSLAELREAARPKIDEVLVDMNGKIAAVLTDEQEDQWETMNRRVERLFNHGFPPDGRGMRGGRRGGFGDGRGGPSFRGDGRQGPRSSGPRPDSNEPRWGGRGFNPFDPNGPRRSLDGRRDPNGLPPRTFDMRQGRDGPSRSFGRRGGMDGRMIEPNAPDRMPLGGPPVDPNHIL